MAEADNSYRDTLFHETQFSIELHAEIMHCAHNYQFSNLLAYN